MSHINGTIPSRFCSTRKLMDDNRLLDYKLKQMAEERDGLLKELRNVYKSVKENGYIILHDEEDDVKIKLIEEPKDKETP